LDAGGHTGKHYRFEILRDLALGGANPLRAAAAGVVEVPVNPNGW
jgi:hypothetical protein